MDVGGWGGGSVKEVAGTFGAFGSSDREVELLRGVLVEGADVGLEGVFAAEGVGVDTGKGPEAWRLSFSSPYSFHSSTSSRSWNLY